MTVFGTKIRCITPEQGRNYLTTDEDTTGTPAVYFSLHRDPADPTWDIVTYYTDILKPDGQPIDVTNETVKK